MRSRAVFAGFCGSASGAAVVLTQTVEDGVRSGVLIYFTGSFLSIVGAFHFSLPTP